MTLYTKENKGNEPDILLIILTFMPTYKKYTTYLRILTSDIFGLF